MAAGAVTEHVAEELEQAAVAARKLDGRALGSLWIGLGIGATVGFYAGYRYSKRKLRKEIFEEAEKEIAAIREHYQQKVNIAEAKVKPPVEDVVKERGYVPAEDEPLKIEYAHLDDPAETRPIPPPVPVNPPKAVIREVPTPKQPDQQDNEPYIITEDEFTRNESGYSQVSYVYYLTDDVLVDESDPQTVLHNRENLIGDEALGRFGYGTDDPNLVYVRNPNLQMEFEITRDPGSWEEDVLGLDTHETN